MKRKFIGYVAWPDGRAGARARISAEIREYSSKSTTQTAAVKEDGTFEIELFEGLKYSLFAYYDGPGSPDSHSQEIEEVADDGLGSLSFVLDQPGNGLGIHRGYIRREETKPRGQL